MNFELEERAACKFILVTYLRVNAKKILSSYHHNMRVTLLRLAESVSARPLNLREASAALYPPIPYAQNQFAKDLAQA